jgi:hypothetical protein
MQTLKAKGKQVNDVNDTLGNAGSGYLVLMPNGTEYAIMPPNQATKAAFIAWMKLMASIQVLNENGAYSPAAYAEKECRLIAYQATKFVWDGEVFNIFVKEEVGADRLILHMMQQKDPDITAATVKTIKDPIAGNPAGLTWAYAAALRAACPSHSSLPTTEKPEGVRKMPEGWKPTLSGLDAPSPNSTKSTVPTPNL